MSGPPCAVPIFDYIRYMTNASYYLIVVPDSHPLSADDSWAVEDVRYNEVIKGNFETEEDAYRWIRKIDALYKRSRRQYSLTFTR